MVRRRALRLVGVRFKPWGISSFVDTAPELRDRCVPADAARPRSVHRIRTSPVASVDGFIADKDGVGPPPEWYSSGDNPTVERRGRQDEQV
ncbi:hypothetical protein AB0F91_32615 [Amycolatopsis sp. NPDC023774]|uniref:hypothetical protein n=1 Tax=Amycolatopsis sp. NPDC023774 TaxID=3155015 RepID=UPI003406779A